MLRQRDCTLAALTTATIAAALTLTRPATAAASYNCWMNKSQQTCTTKPWGKDGFEITFSGGAIVRFVPAGPPTTDNRRMRDSQGRLWLMSGHHSFEIVEQGGDGNRISVSSVPVNPAPAVDHQVHSKVKLSGHGQPTVTLYAKPSFAAAIAGMGVSGETLDKLACTTNRHGTWCQVGYPGQSGRVLWAPVASLIFLGEGE